MNLEKEIKRYSGLNGYPIDDYRQIVCRCGSSEFFLTSDDEEGGAFVTCYSCGTEKDIENSKQYIEDAVLNICNCNNNKLKVGVGKAFYSGTNETRWVYVGAHCGVCGLNGVYVNWKES